MSAKLEGNFGSAILRGRSRNSAAVLGDDDDEGDDDGGRRQRARGGEVGRKEVVDGNIRAVGDAVRA